MRKHRYKRHGQPGVFFGIVMVGLGVLFLLDNLDILETRDAIRTFWPFLILGWGIVRLALGRGGERVIGAAAAVFGGVLLGNRLYDWDINIIGMFWPLILIGFGASVLSRAWLRPVSRSVRPETATDQSRAAKADDGGAASAQGVDESSTIRDFVLMGGIERRNISQSFKGGDVTVMMGGVEIDLRECRMAAGEAHMRVFVMLGGAVFRIPRDWTVESRLGNILAGFEDHSEPAVSAAPKKLVIEGSVLLGGVEVGN